MTLMFACSRASAPLRQLRDHVEMRALHWLPLVARWNVRTSRIGTEHVAALRQCTGTRATAHLAILADSTFSGEGVFVAQRAEHRVSAVNVERIAFPDVPARHRQKAARVHFT